MRTPLSIKLNPQSRPAECEEGRKRNLLMTTAQSQNVVDTAWAEESESRLDAFQTGKLMARSFDDVIKEVNKNRRAGRADS